MRITAKSSPIRSAIFRALPSAIARKGSGLPEIVSLIAGTKRKARQGIRKILAPTSDRTLLFFCSTKFFSIMLLSSNVHLKSREQKTGDRGQGTGDRGQATGDR